MATTNPYRKEGGTQQQRLPLQSVVGTQITENMRPQSQRRMSQKARSHKMQANNVGRRKKRKAGDQLTLTGGVAFAPLMHCVICKAWAVGVTPPHRGHHRLCWINPQTKGITSKTTLDSLKETERLRKLFAAPIDFSSRNLSCGTSFFCAIYSCRSKLESNTNSIGFFDRQQQESCAAANQQGSLSRCD